MLAGAGQMLDGGLLQANASLLDENSVNWSVTWNSIAGELPETATGAELQLVLRLGDLQPLFTQAIADEFDDDGSSSGGGIAQTGGPEPVPGGEQGDADDEPSDDEDETAAQAEDAAGCGCTSGTRGLDLAALLVVLGVARRRRRGGSVSLAGAHPSGSNSSHAVSISATACVKKSE